VKTPMFARTDKSLLARWWWSVDRTLLLSFFILMFFGVLLTMSGSPAVAERLHLDSFYFVKRHLILLIPTIGCMMFVSFLKRSNLQLFCVLMLIGILFLMVLTPILGQSIKGAKRWLNIYGFSLQASEFLKPIYCVMNAWILSRIIQGKEYLASWKINLGFYLLLVGLLVAQPDLGMIIIITSIWCVQIFIAGVSTRLIAVVGAAGTIGLGLAYLFLPHVTDRINKFFFPTNDKYGASYQIEKSINAFRHGGFWGTGPGEGVLKKYLPDAHADFIFSVAGEEFGWIACAIIIVIFMVIFFTTLKKLMTYQDHFLILSCSGLIISFSTQAIVNMASALNLIPTKGMTLPFISYGGSSLIALGIHTGLLLALTRNQERH
jgi:cell division protein FtsW